MNDGNMGAFRLAHVPNKIKSNGWVFENFKHPNGVIQHYDEEQDLGKGVEENGKETEDKLEGEDPIKSSSLRKEPDRTLLEESDDAKDTRKARNTCCEEEKVLLPCFLKQGVCVPLELLQVVLIKESPDAELDDQLGDALDERLEGGDVSHVVGILLLPVRFPGVKLVCSRKGEILGPNL